MIPENTLEISSVSGYPSSCVTSSQGSSSVVDQSFKFGEGLTTTPEGAQSPVHRCFPKRLGCSLKTSNSQWPVESQSQGYKHSRAKNSVL